MYKNRIIELNEQYKPISTYEGDEIYRNGVFQFNIKRIMEAILEGEVEVDEELMEVSIWFKHHVRDRVNEHHLTNVNLILPVVQAEIKPGCYEIIDGNHRMEAAYRRGIQYVPSYKLRGEQLLPFFIDPFGYRTFVDYWNSKL